MRPASSTEDVRYAVHTRSCTFLLDDEGLCHFIVSRTGMVPPDVRGCVGSQFVACLHPELEGGLAGELIVGAAALFVKQEAETGKMVLLRTGPIVYVELRGAELGYEPSVELPPPPDAQPSRGGDTVPPPRFVGAVDYLNATGESTVTLTMPLYRPEVQPFVRR